MDIMKIVEKVADNILHLRCDNADNCFVNNFTESHSTEHKIQKGSALIINPVSCNHTCEPSKACLEHFKYAGIVVRDMRNDKEFKHKQHMQAAFKEQDESTALFRSYEDAHNWSVAKLAEANS